MNYRDTCFMEMATKPIKTDQQYGERMNMRFADGEDASKYLPRDLSAR